MSSKEMDYKAAIVYFFPERLWREEYRGVSKKGKLNGNRLYFKRDGYLNREHLVETVLDNCNIPDALLQNPVAKHEIQKEIIAPVKRQITAELTGAENLLVELFKLAVKNEHTDYLYFQKNGSYFRVYAPRFQRNECFETFLELKETFEDLKNPGGVLNGDFQALLNTARSVGTDDKMGETPYVEKRGSLKEALLGLLTVYERANEVEAMFY